MNKINILFAAAILGAAFTGCSDDKELSAGEGKLFLSTSVSSDVKVVSRASEDELNEKLIIWISSEKGLVRKYEGLANVPADGVKLVGGRYVAEAWTGDSVSASWDAKYYKAYQPFTIAGGDVTVNLNCKIANVLASVNYESTVDEVLSDYTLTVGHDRGELTFEGRDERKAYFMMPSTSKDLTWKLTGTKISGGTFTKEGTIKDVEPAHEYVLNVRYTPNSSSVGGGYFTIEVDDQMVIIENNVVLVAPPAIEGYGFDLSQTQAGEPGAMERRSVVVKAACELKSVVLESELLTPIIGGPDVNLIGMSAEITSQLEEKGINLTYDYNAESDYSLMKVNFEDFFLNSLEEGEHSFKFTATDVNDRIKEGTLTVNITNASVAALPVDEKNVYSRSATVSMSILKENVTNPVISYCPATSREGWTDVPATMNGNTATAVITGLTPGTTYQFRASCDGFTGTEILKFTTESEAQLENAGFETWNTSDKAYLIAADANSLFWDSGNHGSATMNKNVTIPEETIKHSGNYSAKLSSQFVGIGVIGKFAAGNLFVGEYLETDGTDGVLGWGRPFTSRPKALKGYVQYNPAAVTHTKLDDVKKGDMDKGIIYIALVDASVMKTHDGKSYPVIVKTKSTELFSKDDSNVIAYGEKIFDAQTNGMIEFNISLDYYRSDKPAYIVVVCSASKGGDYFTGGDGSVMYVDDFELVY